MRCPVTSNNYKEKYTKELMRNGTENGGTGTVSQKH